MFTIVDIFGDDIGIFSDLLPGEVQTQSALRFLAALDEEGSGAGVLAYEIGAGFVEVAFVGVYPELRRQGIGRALIEELLFKLEEGNIPLPIMAMVPDTETFGPAAKLFESMEEFLITKETALFIVSPQNRQKSDFYNQLKEKKSPGAKNYYEESAHSRKEFRINMQENDFDYLSPEEDEDVIRELCFCTEREGHITSAVFIKTHEEGDLEVALAYSDRHHSMDLALTLSETFKVADERYPDADIVINATNDASRKLAEKIFGENMESQDLYTAISFN